MARRATCSRRRAPRCSARCPTSDVPRLLGEADIGLAPYSPDAPAYFSPLKLFEYLAAGLAVVAADIPGVRDVDGSEAALLIPPGDAIGARTAVAALTADPGERARLGPLPEHWPRSTPGSARAQRIVEVVRDSR